MLASLSAAALLGWCSGPMLGACHSNARPLTRAVVLIDVHAPGGLLLKKPVLSIENGSRPGVQDSFVCLRSCGPSSSESHGLHKDVLYGTMRAQCGRFPGSVASLLVGYHACTQSETTVTHSPQGYLNFFLLVVLGSHRNHQKRLPPLASFTLSSADERCS